MTARHYRRGLLVGLAVAAAACGLFVARAAAGTFPAEAAGPEPPRRVIDDSPKAPTISFIDSPNPTCYRPAPGTGTCYLQWSYLYVTAATSQYVISMTVAIDGEVRAYHAGFFQTYMYVPGEMYGPGFKVTCGFPGASGNPAMGNTYSYVIRARESGGLASANYGSVMCPADVARLYFPLLQKR